MLGINLDRSVEYFGSSLRYFSEGEHHISRICPYDVLVMVFEGVLRFSEDGREIEVSAGEYYIQRKSLVQKGERPSEAPKYLYCHFLGEWGSGPDFLPLRGRFSYPLLRESIAEMDELAHSTAPYVAKAQCFYRILNLLASRKSTPSKAREMASYIDENFAEALTLEELSERFNYSKNYIITLFKKEFSQTPVEYLKHRRLEHAERELETTSLPIEQIAASCGYCQYSNFFRQFVEKNGLSPEAFRKNKYEGIL